MLYKVRIDVLFSVLIQEKFASDYVILANRSWKLQLGNTTCGDIFRT